MLVALLAAYLSFMAFFGGVSDGQFGQLMSHHVEGQIEATIQDKDRRKAALKGLGQVNKDIDQFNKQLSEDLKLLEKMIRDYDSKPADFDQLFADSLARNQNLENKIWEDRKAMLKNVNADEWHTIIQNAIVEREKEVEKDITD